MRMFLSYLCHYSIITMLQTQDIESLQQKSTRLDSLLSSTLQDLRKLDKEVLEPLEGRKIRLLGRAMVDEMSMMWNSRGDDATEMEEGAPGRTATTAPSPTDGGPEATAVLNSNTSQEAQEAQGTE